LRKSNGGLEGALAREAASAAESLVDALLDAFEEESRAVDEERRLGRTD